MRRTEHGHLPYTPPIYWRTDAPCANRSGGPNRKKKSAKHYWRTVSGQHCLLAEGDIGAPIFTSTKSSVRLAYFHTNRLLFGLYKQETEILRRKTTATLKSKQTSIATVRNHLRTLASSPTPLIFHWSLPLSTQKKGKSMPSRSSAHNYCTSSLGRYVFGSEISYNKAPPRLPGLGC